MARSSMPPHGRVRRRVGDGSSLAAFLIVRRASCRGAGAPGGTAVTGSASSRRSRSRRQSAITRANSSRELEARLEERGYLITHEKSVCRGVAAQGQMTRLWIPACAGMTTTVPTPGPGPAVRTRSRDQWKPRSRFRVCGRSSGTVASTCPLGDVDARKHVRDRAAHARVDVVTSLRISEITQFALTPRKAWRPRSRD